MKIKLKNFIVEVKISLVILVLLCLFSSIIRRYFYYYFACYLFVMFHEFSHIFIASLFNTSCKKIQFTICGMSANLDINKKNKKNVFIYLAGPIANLIFAIIFLCNKFIFTINLALFIINLLPMYPLDGYRIFEILRIDMKLIQNIIYIFIIVFFMFTNNFSLIIFLIYIIFIRINMEKII